MVDQDRPSSRKAKTLPLINFRPDTILAQSLGGVLNLQKVECAVPPQVWGQAIRPAALKLFKTIIFPDPKHILHEVTGHTWIHQARNVFRASGATDVAFLGAAGDFMFEIAAGLDIAAYQFFIASVVLEFGIEWVSAAYKMAGCIHDPNEVTLSAKDPIGSIVASGEPQVPFSWHETAPSPGAFTSPGFILPAGWTASTGLACNNVQWFGPFSNVTYKLIDTFDGKVLAQGSSSNGSALGTGAAVVQGHAPAQPVTRTVQWQAFSGPTIWKPGNPPIYSEIGVSGGRYYHNLHAPR